MRWVEFPAGALTVPSRGSERHPESSGTTGQLPWMGCIEREWVLLAYPAEKCLPFLVGALQ